MSEHTLGKNNTKHFLSILDLDKNEIYEILDLAKSIKNKKIEFNFQKKVLGLVFDKVSTRTRVSFQVAMSNLGGTTIDLNPQTSQIGRGEPIKDTSRVLSRYCDVLAVRTFKQKNIEEYAKWSTIPVINALTDLEHPCQALADFLTIQEEYENFNNVTLTYIGDGNNVANSLILCGAFLGAEVRIVCPKGYEPDKDILINAKAINPHCKIRITNDLNAIEGSNVLYTDVWVSMGEEDNKYIKEEIFKGYTINKDTLKAASTDPIVLHCLPAYRGKEISDEVIDSSRSRIFDQAENRLHVQQALLAYFLKS